MMLSVTFCLVTSSKTPEKVLAGVKAPASVAFLQSDRPVSIASLRGAKLWEPGGGFASHTWLPWRPTLVRRDARRREGEGMEEWMGKDPAGTGGDRAVVVQVYKPRMGREGVARDRTESENSVSNDLSE